MRSARFVCSFAILISILVWSQSNRDQFANQPNVMPIANRGIRRCLRIFPRRLNGLKH